MHYILFADNIFSLHVQFLILHVLFLICSNTFNLQVKCLVCSNIFILQLFSLLSHRNLLIRTTLIRTC